MQVNVCLCVCLCAYIVCLSAPRSFTCHLAKGDLLQLSSAQLVLIVRECVRVFCGSSQVPAVSCCSCCCCHCSCCCCYSWRCLLLVERTISPSVCTAAAAVAAGGAVEERARYLLSKQPQATQRWPYYQFTDTHTHTHTQVTRHTANNNRWIGHRQVLCGISKSLCGL